MSNTGLQFEEAQRMFVDFPEDWEDSPGSMTEPYVIVYSGNRKVAQIRANGNVTYGERWLNSTVRYVTFLPEERRQIDTKAREFTIKCAIAKLPESSGIEGELEQLNLGELRFEKSKKTIWETLGDENDGISVQEVLVAFIGRDEIGFITTDGKITLNGTRTPEELEYLVGVARWFRARSTDSTRADRTE